jgi:hypothetical protein
VDVFITSSDTSVASVTSPYTLSAAATAHENTKEVSVMHKGPGIAHLSLASQGAPYGYSYSNYIRVVAKGSLIVSAGSTANASGGRLIGNLTQVAAIVLQRDEALALQLSTLPTAAADASAALLQLSVGVEPALAPPVASVRPANLTIAAAPPKGQGEAAAGRVRVTCHRNGHATLVVEVSGASEAAELMYSGVSRRVPIVCRPGIVISFAGVDSSGFTPSFVSNFVRLQPSEELSLAISLDTPPTTRTELHVRNSAPGLIELPSSIIMPPFSAAARILKVKNLQNGAGDAVIDMVASSPGMLERMSRGCSGAAAGTCAALFRDQEHCSFRGFKANGTRGDEQWEATMARISAAAGAACAAESLHNCYRSACCASAAALECAHAIERAGCNVSMLVPELADSTLVQDASADFGVPPVSLQAQAALYASWVPGLQCEPYVACAWAHCFPGKGNYDQVAAHTLTIRALPGFGIEPPFVFLHQGADERITIMLDLAPSAPVSVRLSVITDLSAHGPVAKVEPALISFEAGVTRAEVTLRWMGAGRASLRLSTDFSGQPAAGEYTNVTQTLPLVISASPGFVYSSQDTSVASGFEPGVFPVVYLQVGSSAGLDLAPSFPGQGALSVAISDDAGLLETSPAAFDFRPPFTAKHVNFTSNKVGPTLLRFRRNPIAAPPLFPLNESGSLLVLAHGFGYTSGTLSLRGYPTVAGGAGSAGDTGLTASYNVGILSWGYYHHPDTLQPLRGHNYSFMSSPTFEGPVSNASSAGAEDGRMRVDKCWGHAEGVTWHGATIGHTGQLVVGCQPSMRFSVVNGRVASVSFDNSSCRVTGLTCQLSLPSGGVYGGGSGFSGYFTTGVTEVSLAAAGAGYTCEWACVLSVHGSGVS